MNQNPFVALRERAGLSRQELALALGVAEANLANAEIGRIANPRALLAALALRGVDAAKLAEDYRQWLLARHQERAPELEARLRAALVHPAGGAA